MRESFKAACVQNCAGPDMAANLAEAESLVRHAAGQGASLICLPEFFSCLDFRDGAFDVGDRAEEEHPGLSLFRGMADELGVWIQMGSLAIRSPTGKIRNRAYMIDDRGGIVAFYDKIHLSDVDLAGGQSYRESRSVEPGASAVVTETPWGRLGLSVCYDLRFAQLYRALAHAGAEFVVVPAAFTKTTGQAHWHVLLRARAIETGSYVLAACQCGTHGEAESYGHSLIIDPWGCILAEGGEEPGVIVSDIDPAKVAEVRRMIPALTHDREFSVPDPDVPGIKLAAGE
ncbi:MAG: carbon-nitrogen hydrolase family protein [Alphaproteobacteria bacterium]|nr:carbon-nitrogen hydrolase family protein [Alphaproteobacteria bacterium]